MLPSQWTESTSNYTCNICSRLILPGIFTANKHHCGYCQRIVCSSCFCSEYREYKCWNIRTCQICYTNQELKEHDDIIKGNYYIFSDELLLHGYFRETSNFLIECLLNDIINLLIVWIGKVCNEKWDMINTDSNIAISQSQQCIKKISGMKNKFYSAFGIDIIKRGMVKIWQFQVIDIGCNIFRSNILIGIVECNDDDMNKFKMKTIIENNDKFVGYALDVNTGETRNKNIGSNNTLFGSKMYQIGNDDLVIMKLDFHSMDNNYWQTGELSFTIIRKHQPNLTETIAFHPDINKEWLLAVKLRNNAKVSLMDQCYIQNDWVFVDTQ